MAKQSKKFIQKAIKKPGTLEKIAAREKGLNRDGTISVAWARKKLKDPKTTTTVKRRINFFLNVLKPAARKRRAKNPVPRGKVAAASDLYRRFRDQNPDAVDEIEIDIPDVGIVVGKCDGILYTTQRGGKTERYIHRFKGRAKPLLCSTSDGKQLFFVGGNYTFTELGIEDN